MTENHESRIKRDESDIKELWAAIADVQKMMMYRLPLWATMVIALLTGICGFLLKAAMA